MRAAFATLRPIGSARVLRTAVLALLIPLLGFGSGLLPAAPAPAAAEVAAPASTTHQATVARLYEAYFLRPPDGEGLAYWTRLADGGLPVAEISGYFAASAEFAHRYGTLDDPGFVRLVYRNVLRREPDPSGYAYWLGMLRGGLTRGALMLGFSESPEFRDVLRDRQARRSNPLAGWDLHVSSWSPAAVAAEDLRSTRPADAARLDLLARTPTARWFGEWSGDVRAAAAGYVREAAAAGALPVLVPYAIPGRDCGSYSGGGAASAGWYRLWIRELAAGIGDRPAAVVVEPDAVALAECLDPTAEDERYALLADAVATLAALPATVVYLDAGHAGWLPVDELVARLRRSGIDRARGIALNVSNFGATEDQAIYATAIADRLGVHAVVDTSRNGAPGDGTWCNPFGRAIGAFPTTRPDAPEVIDALLWVKVPGESDGTCNGGPPAGQFWTEYAVDLVRNAGY
ncbi:MAG TPA: glycoside hydrolase family 6 protein [Acidimicrobiales bacterium]|nr:glycoside hydrolase family 6 protein [Acidimicrobiales bacterium]